MGQSLTVDVGARTVSFEEGMRRAADVANKQMAAIGRSIDGIGNQFSSVTEKFAKFTGILAGIGAGVSFTGMVKGAIDAADQIDKLAQKTGIAHEALAGLSYSAKLSDTDIEGVAASAGKLAKNMVAAATGSASQVAAFNAVGVSVKNADGSLKSTDKVLGELADRFKSYADGPAKAALAQELFGKSGVSMIPLLNHGSEALARQREEALKYSNVTKEVSLQAAEFNDELDKIKLIASGVGTSIAATVLPVLKGVSEVFVWLRDHSKGVSAGLIGIGAAATVFALASSKASAAATALGAAMKTLTLTILANPFGLAATAIGAAAAALYYYKDATFKVGETTASVGDIALGAWAKVKEGFSAAWDWIRNDLEKGKGDWNSFSGVVINIVSAVSSHYKVVANGIIGWFVSVGQTFGIVAGALVEHFSNGFDRVKSLAVSLWDGIKKVFSGDFSFSAFSAEMAKDAAKAYDISAQIKDSVTAAFKTDYVAEFAGSAKTALAGVAESLAIAGQEARKLNAALGGGDGGGGDAPFPGGAGAGFAKLIEGLDKQLAYLQAGYDALYKTFKANNDREIDVLVHTREMELITERDFLQRRGELQKQAAEANVKRLQSTYADLAASLDKVLATPVKTQEESNKRIEKATELQTKMVKVTQELEEAQTAVGDTVRKTGQETEKYYKSIADQVKKIRQSSEDYALSLRQRVDDLKFESSLIGKSASVQAKMRAERELQLGLEKEIRDIKREISDLEANHGDQEKIAALYEKMAKATADTAAAISDVHNAMSVNDWAKDFAQIGQSLSDAIYRGFEKGKSFAENFKDTLVNTFKAMVLKPAIEFVVNNTMGTLGSIFGSGNNGGGGLLSSVSSLFGQGGNTAATSFLDTFSGVFSNGLSSLFGSNGAFSGIMGGGTGGIASMFATSGFGQALGLSTQVMTGCTQAAATTTSMMTSAGAAFVKAIPIIGWIITGMMTSMNLWDQGWRAENDDTKAKWLGGNLPGSSTQVFSSLFGERWGAILSGSAIQSRLFGHKAPELRDMGVQGTFSKDGFSGEMFWDTVAKGGVFRGDKWETHTGPMDRALQRLIDSTIGKVPSQIADLLSEFGQDFDDVFGADWSKWQEVVLGEKGNWDDMQERLDKATIKLYREMATTAVEAIRTGWGEYVSDLKDLEPDEFREEIQKVLGSLNILEKMDEQVKLFGVSGLTEADFEKVADQGEVIYETIARLAETFAATNNLTKFTGIKFSGLGLDGAASRQALVDDAGSAEALSSLTSSYWGTFSTEQEKFDVAAGSLRDIFDKIGTNIPRDVESYKELVAAQDMTTEAGRKMALQLMEVAPAFNEIIGAIDALSASMDAKIGDLRRTFEMGGLDKNETYAYLKNEGDTAFASLQTATSIEDVNKYFEQAIASLNQTFGMLDDGGKRAQKEQFLAQLEELEAVKNERIDAIKDIITGPADAIAESGKRVVIALDGLAEQLGVEVNLKPFTEDMTAAAESVTSSLESINFDLAKPLAIDASDIDLAAADAMSSVAMTLKDAGPAIELANKKGVEAQESAGKTILAAAGEVRSAIGGMQTIVSSLGSVLSNINVNVRATVESNEVGHAY